MSESTQPPSAERQQRRAAEFLQLLPLTLELAGLPKSEHGRYFSEDQIQARTMTLRYAYKAARQFIVEVVNPT
jgi:hypothetical protein